MCAAYDGVKVLMSILSISTGAFCVRNCCLCVCVQMILLFCHSCCCRRRPRTEGKMFAICFAWKFKTYTIENRIADNPIIDATRAQPKPSIELNGFFCVHCEFFIVPSHEHTQIKLNSRHSFFWRFSHPAHTFAEKKFTTWSSKFDCAYDNVRSSFVDWMCFLWVWPQYVAQFFKPTATQIALLSTLFFAIWRRGGVKKPSNTVLVWRISILKVQSSWASFFIVARKIERERESASDWEGEHILQVWLTPYLRASFPNICVAHTQHTQTIWHGRRHYSFLAHNFS